MGRPRRRTIAAFLAGFLVAFGGILYLVSDLGTRDFACVRESAGLRLAGTYCDAFYPELFFLNAALGIDSNDPLAGAAAFLSWALLAALGGCATLLVLEGVLRPLGRLPRA